MTFRPIIGILALVFLMHSATASSQTLGEIEENVVALGCNWQPFTPDQTAFAAQPGGVFPLNDVVAGSYRILVGPAGKDGHDLPPATWNAFGPYNLRGGHKYKALIEGPGGKFLRFEEDSADLLLYSSPPAGFARVYARNNCVGDTWYAICLKPIEPAEGADPVAKTSAPATGKLLEEPTRVADTTNIAAVHNGPTAPTTFSINSPYLVTEIHDYHWNNAQGATPGTIGLQDQNGKMYGPWQAVGTPGQYGVTNANWFVYPNIVIPAGVYTIIDSDPATWSQNEESGGKGMSYVMATPVEGAPASQTTSYDLTGKWNIDANGHKGTIDITKQSGNEFTGTVHIDAGRTERLINGRITGNTITFTRMWDGQSLRQDYTGTLTIDANGKANMRGTFTQNGAHSWSWSASKSMPAQAQACDWTGTWKTTYGEMKVVQTGNRVTGTYTHDKGKIEGMVSGDTLKGTWSEAPSYKPSHDAGDTEFTISGDCNSFTGRWRYGSTGAWRDDWTGTRIIPTPTPTPVEPAPVTPTPTTG